MLRAQIAPRSGIFPIFAVSACVLKKLSSTYLNLFFNSCYSCCVFFFISLWSNARRPNRLDPVRQAPVSPWIPGEEHPKAKPQCPALCQCFGLVLALSILSLESDSRLPAPWLQARRLSCSLLRQSLEYCITFAVANPSF